MKIAETRWVNVVWCDDIRQEIGNKPSLMGVYTGGLDVPALPATLPRLAAWINVYTPTSHPFKRLTLRIRRSDADEPIASIEIGDMSSLHPPSADQLADPTVGDSDKPTATIMSFVVMLGAFQLNEDTHWLKVFVETEDEMLESFKLPIKKAPAGAF
jgi:hypothetical protein